MVEPEQAAREMQALVGPWHAAVTGPAQAQEKVLERYSLFSSEDEHEGVSRQGTVARGAKERKSLAFSC